MAFSHGSTAKIYITDSGATERDISSVSTEVQFSPDADTADTTTFGNTAKTYIAGLKDSKLSVNGPRDATYEGYIYGVLGTTTVWAYCPEGSASGKIKYSGTAICTGLGVTSSVGDANRFSAEFQVTGAVTRATL